MKAEEELKKISKLLDEAGVPRKNGEAQYSVLGRVTLLVKSTRPNLAELHDGVTPDWVLNSGYQYLRYVKTEDGQEVWEGSLLPAEAGWRRIEKPANEE